MKSQREARGGVPILTVTWREKWRLLLFIQTYLRQSLSHEKRRLPFIAN